MEVCKVTKPNCKVTNCNCFVKSVAGAASDYPVGAFGTLLIEWTEDTKAYPSMNLKK